MASWHRTHTKIAHTYINTHNYPSLVSALLCYIPTYVAMMCSVNSVRCAKNTVQKLDAVIGWMADTMRRDLAVYLLSLSAPKWVGHKDTIEESSWQYCNIGYHAYVCMLYIKYILLLRKSTLFDAYVNHGVFEIANNDDDDDVDDDDKNDIVYSRFIQFSVILNHLCVGVRTCTSVCVCVFILLIRIKAFSIFPSSRTIKIDTPQQTEESESFGWNL